MNNFNLLAILRPPVLAGLWTAAATTGIVLAAKPAMALTVDPILTLNGDQTTWSGDGPWNLGFSFTTASSQTFNALGVADYGAVGLSQIHDIGLMILQVICWPLRLGVPELGVPFKTVLCGRRLVRSRLGPAPISLVYRVNGMVMLMGITAV